MSRATSKIKGTPLSETHRVESLDVLRGFALLGILPYAQRTDGMSKSKDVARSGKIQAAIVCGFGLIITYLAIYIQWIDVSQAFQLWGLVIAVTMLLGWRFQKRVGGLTGDFLGATQQLAQLGILAGLLWASHG